MDIINWQPDKTKNVPLYKQLTDYIKMKLSSGDWPIGTKIPSQRTMSEMFQINRSTVNTALNELVADGLLETCMGSGTKVADNSWSILASSSSMWNPYTQRGLQQPNLTTVQKINTY
jgi:GntR family transcriptional regulator, regulator for abcA and norABC